jgi:serine/threonine-protein kinase RsbW
VRDWGRCFEPDGVQDPDITAPLEERTLGGLGLFLIRRYMDQVEYTFDPILGNELLMIKALASE